jgi:hypothetical protein
MDAADKKAEAIARGEAAAKRAMAASHRELRNYDREPEDSEEIAEHWGIDLEPDDSEEYIPEWVKKYGPNRKTQDDL